MKQILYISFLFFSLLSFAQQNYRVTEGELQLIVPKKGIIILKEHNFYILKKKYNFELDNEDRTSIYKFELEKISNSEFEEYSKSADVIFASDVNQLNWTTIKNSRFTETTEDDLNQFYYLNNDIFVYSRIDNYSKNQKRKELYPFLILNFKNNRQIIYFEDGLIVPLKKELKLLLNNKQSHYSFEENIKLKANEISIGHFSEINQYYEIDTIKKDKKVFLKNMFFKNVFNKSYDSIDTNRDFIVGYDKKRIDVYNYQLQRLHLNKIRAIHLEKYFPKAQIISKNTLININLLGKEYKKGDGPGSIDLSFQFPDTYVKFKINREDKNYYLTGEINSLISNNSFYGSEKIKLLHTSDIDSLEYTSSGDDYNSITLYTESGYSKKFPMLIYSILKDKKYNLNTFDYFLVENLNSEQKKVNDALPKNLDSLMKINNDVYFIMKNNLCTYYPIIREIKYKSIEKFQGNFARFELPNGQKGWLSKDGKEYFDE
jgi:hypothetical protein